jgi:hypothetical protein
MPKRGIARNLFYLVFCGTTPFNDRDALFCVEELLLMGFKPVASKHLLWSSHRYFRKYRSSAWQAHSRRA